MIITATAANVGGSAGKYRVTLKLNGLQEEVKEVALSANTTQPMSFLVRKTVSGNYAVDLNGLTGSFTVAPQPAIFKVSGLKVAPDTIRSGEAATITTTAANVGGSAGKYRVTLKLNGLQEEVKEVSLSANTTQQMSFLVSRAVPGNYAVDVNGLTGSFTVAPEPEALPANIWLIPVIVTVIGLGLITGLIGWRRRKQVVDKPE
ncbi:MAG: hypothetical protein HYX83_00670 [Chloroflexi bacterium]|nr:hypothetical protein [Chloroflexota bacterium]